MPDPAERIRVEPKTARTAKITWSPSPPNRRTVAGAALAAMMVGIVVNAVALQHGRRLDLGPTASARTPLAAVAPSSAPSPVPQPPRPALATVALASATKPEDPIAGILRGQAADKRKLTLAAQAALADLGFVVKPSGAFDSQTRTALASFEKAHHLPVSTEITPKVVRALKAAAN